jgi:hypothetical protein
MSTELAICGQGSNERDYARMRLHLELRVCNKYAPDLYISLRG